MRFKIRNKATGAYFPTNEYLNRTHYKDIEGDLSVRINLDGSFEVTEYKLLDVGFRWACRDSEDFELFVLDIEPRELQNV